MRKDYFSQILKTHISTRSSDESSFCELHVLTSDENNHNSIFCNLADWDDSFTMLLEILASKELSLVNADDEKYHNFLKVSIPSYLFWMNVLRENLHTLDKNIKNELGSDSIGIDWCIFMPKIQCIRHWANFQKHPGNILKIHHPKIEISEDNETKTNQDEYIFDCEAAKKYFGGGANKKEKDKLLDELSQIHNKWIIKYPNIIQLHTDILKELSKYLKSLQERLLIDKDFSHTLECLYNKPWGEI